MNEQRNLVRIGQSEIQQVFYKGHPVLTYEQIAAAHGTTADYLRNLYRRHKSEFIEGEDTFRLDFAEASQMYLKDTANHNGLTLFTEGGYLLLVKPMRDKLSWRVQREMRAAYFQAKNMAPQAAEWERAFTQLTTYLGPMLKGMQTDIETVRIASRQGDENLWIALDREREARERDRKVLEEQHQRELDELKKQLESMQTVAAGPEPPAPRIGNTVRDFVWLRVGILVDKKGQEWPAIFVQSYEHYMCEHFKPISTAHKHLRDATWDQDDLLKAYDTPGFGTTKNQYKVGDDRLLTELVDVNSYWENKKKPPFPRVVKSPRNYTPGRSTNKD